MSDKSILAKIRKCLALAKSANENEAAAALSKARELMDAHGIDAETLALSDFEESAVRGQGAQRPPLWENLLVKAVECALNVTSFIDDDLKVRFVGRGPSAEIAAYAFAVLFRQLKHARSDYIASKLRRCKIGRKRARADIFCQAWSQAVCSKILALFPVPAVDDELKKYLAIRHPGLVEVKSRSSSISGRVANDDWWSGHKAGRQVDLNQGVGTAHTPDLLS